MNPSCIKKVLSFAKAHMSLGALKGSVASTALVAGASMVSIPEAGDWAGFYSS